MRLLFYKSESLYEKLRRILQNPTRGGIMIERQKEEEKKMMPRRKTPKIVLIVSVILTVILLFSACQKPVLPSDTYSLHTELQASYLADDKAHIDRYASGQEELSRPRPVTLDFSEISDNLEEIELSKDPDFDASFTCSLQDKKAEIYNLEIGVTYYYRVKKSDGAYGETAAFRTEDAAPRNLYVSGVTNVRDLGGYTLSNGRIRQGLLYRGGRLNKNKAETPTPSITEKGIRTMKETMGIKTEIDLRRADNNEIGALTASVLGEDVTYLNLPMTYDTSEILSANEGSIRALFACLAKEENYPIYFHCSIGTDRTGFSAVLMLSLLGAELDDIEHDYLFSNFGNIGGSRSVIDFGGFILYLSLFKGESLREKTEAYLLSIGVTAEEIASFRAIMIEPN